MTDRDVVVRERFRAADRIAVFELVAPPGERLPPWQAGAHIDVRLPTGEVRQYSLCGPLGDPVWRIAVRRDDAGRGGSAWLHSEIGSGARLAVLGPRNTFSFQPVRGERCVFVAGGIGVTPLVPMLEEARAVGADYRLHYAGRSRSGLALVDELERLHPGRVHVYAADEGRRIDLPDLLAAPGVPVVCCGPERMLAEAERVAAGPLLTERFASRPPTGSPSEPFEVELASSGTVLQVPAGVSLLTVLEEHGAWVMSSCAEGVCGTCETRVLAGRVDHRDSILTERERRSGDAMYVCVSRGHERLLLDL